MSIDYPQWPTRKPDPRDTFEGLRAENIQLRAENERLMRLLVMVREMLRQDR